MSANFFSDALRQAMANRHFNQAQLAEFLGVDPAYVSRWLKGSSPRIDQMRNVLTTLGWELDRARPDYDPFADAITKIKDTPDPQTGKKIAEKSTEYKKLDDIKDLLEGAAEAHKRLSHEPVPLYGGISAADGVVSYKESDKAPDFDSLTGLYGPVEYADNALYMLTVSGNELAPTYLNGARLLLRRVLQPNAVPNGAEVILEAVRKPGKLHLRRLVRVMDKDAGRVEKVIGLPMVEGQEYLFFKPREVKLHSVVVGSINTHPNA